jgi:SAM-dependent methyltransferase
MPLLEQRALGLCRGNILDIGCGAGNHALHLQKRGLNVTGLDISGGATETCRLRGLKKVVNASIYDIDGMSFDTLLLLMNGIGIAGSLPLLDGFLIRLKSLLKPGGQILLDSTDIIYKFDPDDHNPARREYEDGIRHYDNYYGEVTFIMEYKGTKGNPFQWLYLDYGTLKEAVSRNNLSCELVTEGDHYDYLARLLNTT